MLNKIQIDQIRCNAENGTATSKDCLELLGHMQEYGMFESSLVKKISENIDSFINVEIDHCVTVNEKQLTKFIAKNS